MTVWLTIGALAGGTAVLKAAGPVAGGRRRPSPRVANVIVLIAPALLAALVVYETVHAGTRGFAADARLGGVAAAALALAARLPLVAVIALAAVATALTRALV
jgi:hypothetical protein